MESRERHFLLYIYFVKYILTDYDNEFVRMQKKIINTFRLEPGATAGVRPRVRQKDIKLIQLRIFM